MGYLEDLENWENKIKETKKRIEDEEKAGATRKIIKGYYKHLKDKLDVQLKERKNLVFNHRKRILDRLK